MSMREMQTKTLKCIQKKSRVRMSMDRKKFAGKVGRVGPEGKSEVK